MKCHSPVNIRDPVQPDSKHYIAVPCGRCAACLTNKRSEWVIRMKEELKISVGAAFITLTYNEKNVPHTDDGLLTLDKKDLQNFFKRLRKNDPIKIKYYAVGEYGSNFERPHYHAICFNVGSDINLFRNKVEKAWSTNKEPIGRIDCGPAQGSALSYCAGYIINRYDFPSDGRSKPFSLISKSLGISYVEKRKKWHMDDLTRQYVAMPGGIKLPLPRYYKQKLFDKRQLLQIKKLNDARIEKENLEFDTEKEAYLTFTEMDRKEAYRRKFNQRSKKMKL